MRIRFHSEAELELCEAREWYAYQRQGLDAEFMRCMDEVLARIKITPGMFPFVLGNVRKKRGCDSTQPLRSMEGRCLLLY